MASCVSGGNVGAGVFVTVGGRGVRVLVSVTIVGVGEASVGVADGDGGTDVSVGDMFTSNVPHLGRNFSTYSYQGWGLSR